MNDNNNNVNDTHSTKQESTEDESEALLLARRLCEKIHTTAENPTSESMCALKDDLQKLYILVQQSTRETCAERSRFLIEKDLLTVEMHADQVDREANAARVAERQRFLFERHAALTGQSASLEKATASAAYVEAALSSLCPYVNQKSPGSDQLAEAAKGGL